MAGQGHGKVSSKTERDFRQKTGLCDVVFQIRDEKIYASKAVLSIASPVFCEMFRHESPDVITLTDVVAENFIEFLKYIYPDRDTDLNDTSVYRLLPFAHKYKVGNLRANCAQLLLKIVREQHTENATQLYRHIKLSELYDMEDVKKQSVGYASDCMLCDMDEAQRVRSILPDTHLHIQRTALRKLEIFKKRTEIFLKYIDKNQLRCILDAMLDEKNYVMYRFCGSKFKPEDKNVDFMQAICLVFEYLNDNLDLKQKALKTVKSILPLVGKDREIFDLLPEDLKYQIENLN